MWKVQIDIPIKLKLKHFVINSLKLECQAIYQMLTIEKVKSHSILVGCMSCNTPQIIHVMTYMVTLNCRHKDVYGAKLLQLIVQLLSNCICTRPIYCFIINNQFHVDHDKIFYYENEYLLYTWTWLIYLTIYLFVHA